MRISTKHLLGVGGAAIAGTAALSSYLLYEASGRHARLIPYLFAGGDVKGWQAEDLARRKDFARWLNRHNAETFSIQSHDGLRLYASCVAPEKPSDTLFFCCHGYRGSMAAAFALQTEKLHEAGCHVFLVDERAHGRSEGNTISFGENEKEDCLKWLDLVIHRYPEVRNIVLYGVSMGSAIVLLMSGDERLPGQVRFIIADCGYTSIDDQLALCLKQMFHLPAFPLLPMADLLSPALLGFSIKKIRPVDAVRKARVPILFVHGLADHFIPAAMACELYNACSTDKDLLLIEGAHHAGAYKKDPEKYRAAVRYFLERYLK